MFRVSSYANIEASPARVWRALCDPDEVVLWDSGVIAAIDAPADYPKPGQRVRWRFRAGPLRTLIDLPQAVEQERLLRALLSLGPFRYDETYRLEPTASGCRLSVEVDARVGLPLIGGIVEHLYFEAATKRAIEASLRSIKAHCEQGPK